MKKSLEALRQKVLTVLRFLFGASVAVTLLGGGLTMLSYVIALIVGGDLAAQICEFTYGKIWPVIIMIANITIVLGLIAMYINGDKALSPSEKKKKLTKDSDAEGTDD